MMDDARYDFLAQVASMYYKHEMTQQAIAEELGLSRAKVYRLLKEAREQGIVQITINWRIQRDAELEQALKEAFALKDTLVLQTSPHYSDTPVLSNLGRMVARYLEQVLKDGTTLAICLGRSTYEVINAIRSDFHAKVTVVQAVGSMPVAMQEADSSELVRKLGQKLDGDVAYLSAPLLADNAEAAAVLRRQSGIKNTLQAARDADVALVGIGNLGPDATAFGRASLIAPEEMPALVAEGAVGEIVGWTYDLDGIILSNHFTNRLIGITLEDLGQIPNTIAVARGPEKAAAILGALRTGIIDVFGTDNTTASTVLSLGGE